MKNNRLRVVGGSSDLKDTSAYRNVVTSIAKARKDDTIKVDLQYFVSKEKQYGKKIGKHAQDFGLDASNETDRLKMHEIIADIVSNKDEIRVGSWRGQENDVVIT